MGQTLLSPNDLGWMRRLGTIISAGALLAFGVAGCGASVSHAGASATGTSAIALATPAPTTAATPTPVITPASTRGWATYRDPRFGFQVPLPPGWQPASITWPPQTDPGGSNDYIVQFFPPGPHGDPGPGATSMAPELIEISLTLSGPSSALDQNSGFAPEPGAVALGTSRVTLYDRGSPGNGGEIVRAAEATLATHPLLFEMHYLAEGAWVPTTARRDIALYLAMMQGFQPSPS